MSLARVIFRMRRPEPVEDDFLPEITEVLLRVARSMAWDEGYTTAGVDRLTSQETPNPYRAIPPEDSAG